VTARVACEVFVVHKWYEKTKVFHVFGIKMIKYAIKFAKLGFFL
jgi:hypothetical protein